MRLISCILGELSSFEKSSLKLVNQSLDNHIIQKKVSMCILRIVFPFFSLPLSFLSFFFVVDRFDYFEIICSIIFVRKFFSSHLHVTIKATSIDYKK